VGQKSILTNFQKNIFFVISGENFFRENFYFSGGTALAEFYLKHRYSEDLDFFTLKKISYSQIQKILNLKMAKMGVDNFETRAIGGTKIFFFKREKKEVVKVEFDYFPFKRLQKGKKFKGIEIDSLFDLAVNKLNTILTRRYARDYIDLYFILRQEEYSWQKLLNGIRKKFSWQVDPFNLAVRLGKIEELHDYPRMIKKFSRSQMIKFYQKQAIHFNQKIFKD